MKVGLSYSRCIRDIYEGKVNMEDVLVVISRTDFDPTNDQQWAGIWDGYCHGGLSNPEWQAYSDKESEFRNISEHLYKDGKLHQPRQFGAHPRRRPEIWLETVLVEGDLDANPMAKKAFEKFQMVAGLSNLDLDKEYN
jgi:hypothetical protein